MDNNHQMDNQIYSPYFAIPLSMLPFLADWLPFMQQFFPVIDELVKISGVLISGGWLVFALYKHFKKQK
jgi:hypothetical protein